ncbi:MAG: PilZ domain-containing protein [Clostridiales bacterium]|nr:PilZ domain-containing protein [Clostridiales bacterium]
MPRANKASKQEQELKLRSGMTVEVLTRDNQVVFLARVVEMHDKSVKLTSVSGDDVPQVFYNAEIKLRSFLSDMKTVLFEGVVRGSSENFWIIEELKGQVRQGRAFYRQSVSTKAHVSCVNGIYAPNRKRADGGKIAACDILDISGGGVRVSCKEKFEEGDWLFIMDANFAPVKDQFSFTCRVLRVEFKRNMYIYGCQFEGLSQKEQDRLIEAIFVLQREETQHKSGRRGW